MSEVSFTDEDLKRELGLAMLRKPFEAHQVLKMCKSTKKDNPPGRCNACGGWHKLPSVQLSYVGHAAITDRLLDADPLWAWEPLAFAPNGSPLLDADGGMWIRLTVCGVTRIGYGDAQGKSGGDAMKERIGDALRNAAMRFGAALELWHKGELHVETEDGDLITEREAKKFGAVPRKGEQGGGQQSDPPPPVTAKADKRTEFPFGAATPAEKAFEEKFGAKVVAVVPLSPQGEATLTQDEPISPRAPSTPPDASPAIVTQSLPIIPPLTTPPPAKETNSPKRDKCINKPQRDRLWVLMGKSKRTKDDLKSFLKTIKTLDHPDGIESTNDIPANIYEVVCAFIEGGK